MFDFEENKYESKKISLNLILTKNFKNISLFFVTGLEKNNLFNFKKNIISLNFHLKIISS